MKKTLIATTALVATAAAGSTVLLASPASADVERPRHLRGGDVRAQLSTASAAASRSTPTSTTPAWAASGA